MDAPTHASALPPQVVPSDGHRNCYAGGSDSFTWLGGRIKRLSVVFVAVLGVAGVELFVTSSTAEAECVKCGRFLCFDTPHRGGVACGYSGGYCVEVGGCGSGPAYRPAPGSGELEEGPILTAQSTLATRPIVTLAEAMDDRDGDLTLRPTGACIPEPTVIATCSIPNGQSSLTGCKSRRASGSRVRKVVPAQLHLAVPTPSP